MALTIKLTPGAVVTGTDAVTAALLNLLANPTVSLEGSVGALALGDGSVTTPKLADGVLSADATGRGKMADLYLTVGKLVDGILSADATGRGKMANGYLTAVLMEETTRAGVMQFAAGTLSGSVYAVTLSPAATAYTAGMVVRFTADVAGGQQVAVNGLAAKTIRWRGVSLTTNDITAGMLVEVVYDGTNFQLTSTRGYLAAEPVVAAGRNITVKNSVGTPASIVEVTADELVVKSGVGGVAGSVLLGGLDVFANITVVGANGRDAGNEAPSTWYYIWVIYNPTTATAAGILSLVNTYPAGPAMPSGYTHRALVGAVYNDGSSNFVTFYQLDRTVWLNESVVFTGQTGVATYTSQTLSPLVPPIALRAWGTAGVSSNVSKGMAVAADGNGLGACTVAAAQSGAGATNTFFMAGHWNVPLKSSQAVFWLSEDTAANYRLTVSGYQI